MFLTFLGLIHYIESCFIYYRYIYIGKPQPDV